jgi:hypothetical protein
VQTGKLLRGLLHRLSETIKVWEVFKSDDGDRGYVSEMNSYPEGSRVHVRNSLRAIKSTFEELKIIRQELRRLYKDCRSAAKDVSSTIFHG